MTETTIHLVFKTHLDIGFTNLAQRVREQYHRHFLPQALETGEHFYGEDPERPKFIWTTGAWLIADYLASAGRDDARRLERAVERGLIRWHALPFTTHTELMSPALFRAGLSYSQELDRRFGRVTRAAKMTDVPGHTRGMVSLLAEAGIRFLHLGVNEASPVPGVPPVFRWRADGGEEIVVMYQDSYGATHFPEGMADGLSFAHTNDNAGPQSVSQTIDAYRHLQTQHPEAAIMASSLDQYGDILWAARDRFPVIDIEIGDSWIHGAGSDPTKISRFLALQRLYDQFANDLTPARLAFGRGLALVPEHTWGIDVKTFLRDEAAWDRPAFDAARRSDPRFAFAERSWAEQRAYLDAAIAQLDDKHRAAALDALPVVPAEAWSGQSIPASEALDVGGWSFAVDPQSGDLTALTTPDGRRVAGQDGTLLGYRYESYDDADVTEHMNTYLTRRPVWAILDHGKPGLAEVKSARAAEWQPSLTQIVKTTDALSIQSGMAQIAHRELGAPASLELVLHPLNATTLSIALIARDKPANRMPEASFLSFAPQGANDWHFRKLGLWQPADRTAPHGGGQLQAVEAVRANLGAASPIEIAPLDTPLVAPRTTRFMRFDPHPPSFTSGIRFNLHNNKWGTNFPMWWEGNLLARFTLRF